MRGIIGQAIEQARQEKLIGNALEAAVVLNSDSEVTAKIDKEELEEFFILSDLTIQQAKGSERFGHRKRPTRNARAAGAIGPNVGTSKAHPDLCDRCGNVVTMLEKTS